MKKILLLVLNFLLVCNLFAQTDGVKWEQGTFADALNKAKSNKKGPNLIFLDCYTTWCGPCKQMANNVFPTKEAGDYFNKNFVNIKIDMEKGEGKDIAKKYSVAAYPTFLILDSQGNEIGRVVGGGELDKFIKRVEKAKDPNNSPKQVKVKFDNDKSVENAELYLKSLEASFLNSQMADFFTENLNELQPKDFLSYPIWKYFSRNLSSNSNLLSYLIANKSLANSYLGSEVVNSSIINAYRDILLSYIAGKKELNQVQLDSAVNAINLLSKDSDKVARILANVSKLNFANNTEALAKMYNFNNYAYLPLMDQQLIERLFASVPSITTSQIEDYYKQKEAFYQQQIKGCASWKDMFIKAKEKK